MWKRRGTKNMHTSHWRIRNTSMILPHVHFYVASCHSEMNYLYIPSTCSLKGIDLGLQVLTMDVGGIHILQSNLLHKMGNFFFDRKNLFLLNLNNRYFVMILIIFAESIKIFSHFSRNNLFLNVTYCLVQGLHRKLAAAEWIAKVSQVGWK